MGLFKQDPFGVDNLVVKVNKLRQENGRFFVTHPVKWNALGVLQKEDVEKCFNFAWDMTFGGKGKHRNCKVGGKKRSMVMIFADTLQGKFGEFFLYRYLYNLGIDVQPPNMEMWGEGKYDDGVDIVVGKHNVSVKTRTQYANVLPFDTEAWTKEGEYIYSKVIPKTRCDRFVLVRVQQGTRSIIKRVGLLNSEIIVKDVLVPLIFNEAWGCDVPGFVTPEYFKYIISKGSIIGDSSYTTQTDDFYIQAGDLIPLNVETSTSVFVLPKKDDVQTKKVIKVCSDIKTPNLFGGENQTACDVCPLQKHIKANVRSDVIDPDVMIVGEMPSGSDVSSGRLFTDVGGRYLTNTLNSLGVSEDSYFTTTAVLCGAPDGKLTKELAQHCKDKLISKINKIQPRVVLLLGNAMFSLFPDFKKTESVSKNRGRFLASPEVKAKVMITYNPGSVVTDPYKSRPFVEDIRKAFKLARGTINLVVENDYTHVTDIETFGNRITEVKKVGLFGFDIETTNKRNKFDCYTENILSMAFSIKEKTGFGIITDKHPKSTWTTEEWWNILGELRLLLGDSGNKAIVHNESFETSFLSKQLGIEFKAYADTMLMHFLLDETSPHKLKVLVDYNFPELAGYDGGIDKSHMETVDVDKLVYYNTVDSDVTLRLYHIYLKQLQDNNFTDLFEFVMEFRRVLTQMEMVGVSVNTNTLMEVKGALNNKLLGIEKEIYASAGKEFNISSTKQLGDILKGLELKTNVKTDSGAESYGEAALKKLKSKHKLPDLVLKYRNVGVLINNCLEGDKGIEININPVTHKIHTNYLVHGTKTGRTSSQDPNLQNVPRTDTEVGKMIRNIFVPRASDWKWVEADYKQLEYRILLSYVKDESLLDIIRQGRDPHGETAAKIFNVAQDKVTKGQRVIAKGVVFGLIYGRGASSIAAELGISEAEGKRVVSRFFTTHRSVEKWIDDQKSYLRKNRETVSFFGRKRRLPTINSNDGQIRAGAEREGVNFIIQATASDICSKSLVRLWYRLKEEKFQAVPILTIHDALIVETPDIELDRVKQVMEEEMTRQIPGILVPLALDFKVMSKWGDG